MYLNIGTEIMIKDNDILGIFDLDNTTVSKATREYINTSSKNNECVTVSFEELPKEERKLNLVKVFGAIALVILVASIEDISLVNTI